MKKCPQCNTENSNNANFCVKCGYYFNNTRNFNSQNKNTIKNIKHSNQINKKRPSRVSSKSHKFNGGTLIVLLISLSIIIGILSYNNSGSNKPTVATRSTHMVTSKNDQINDEQNIIQKNISKSHQPIKIDPAVSGKHNITLDLENNNNSKPYITSIWEKIYDTRSEYHNVKVVICSNIGQEIAFAQVGSPKLTWESDLAKGYQHDLQKAARKGAPVSRAIVNSFAKSEQQRDKN